MGLAYVAGVDWLLRKSRCRPKAVLREGAQEGLAVDDVAEDVVAGGSRGSETRRRIESHMAPKALAFMTYGRELTGRRLTR